MIFPANVKDAPEVLRSCAADLLTLAERLGREVDGGSAIRVCSEIDRVISFARNLELIVRIGREDIREIWADAHLLEKRRRRFGDETLRAFLRADRNLASRIEPATYHIA